jgi:hypothetical protein
MTPRVSNVFSPRKDGESVVAKSIEKSCLRKDDLNRRSRVNIADDANEGLKSLNTNEVEATRFPSIVKQDPNELKTFGRQRSTKKPHCKKEESTKTA